MISSQALLFGLVLARVGSFVAVMPLFSGRGTPRVVRVGLALALAIFWMSSLPNPGKLDGLHLHALSQWLAFVLVLGREVVLGGMAGLLFALLLAPARIAGEMVSQQIGLAQSTLLGPAADSPASPLTLVLETLAGMVFLQLDGHHVVLAVLHASFHRYPLGSSLLVIPIEPLTGAVSSAESLGVLLAGPLALCLFLVTVILALIARMAPQVNIYTVGFTLQAGAAIVAAFFLLPDLIRFLVAVFDRMSQTIAGAM